MSTNATFDSLDDGLRVAILGGRQDGRDSAAGFSQVEGSPTAADSGDGAASGESRAAYSAQWGIEVTTDNLAAAREADLILIGVKPITVPELVEQIRPSLTPKKLLISFAASVNTAAIEKAADTDIAVIRSDAEYSIHA